LSSKFKVKYTEQSKPKDRTPSKESSNIANQIINNKTKSGSIFSFDEQSFKPTGKYPIGQVAELNNMRNQEKNQKRLSITMFYKKKNQSKEMNMKGTEKESKSYSSLNNKSSLNQNKEHASFSEKNCGNPEKVQFEMINKDSLMMSGKATPGFLARSKSGDVSNHQISNDGQADVSVKEHFLIFFRRFHE
jgi:hypothetical protein